MGVARHEIRIETARKTQILNVTQEVVEACGRLGISEGILHVGVRHTTCALCVNEDETGLRQDFERLGETLLNPFRGKDGYRHDQIDDNAQAHLTSVLLGNSVTLSLKQGKPVLGTWQCILLLEMDGPRPRMLDLTAVGE